MERKYKEFLKKHNVNNCELGDHGPYIISEVELKALRGYMKHMLILMQSIMNDCGIKD